MVPQLLQTATQDLVTRFLPFGGSASPSELAKNSTSSNNLLAATQDDGQGPSIRMLPEDVLLLILSWLGPEDVVACKRTCRFLHRIAAADARLQYRLALAASGMVNGPPSGMALDERAERLEAYCLRTKATRNPEFSVDENVWPRQPPPVHVQVLVCDRTVFYSAGTGTGAYDVEIRSPGSAPRHLALEMRMPTLMKAADVSQDLLIVGEPVEYVGIGPRVKLKMHLLSIKTGRPHPAAAVPWIEVGCEHGTETPAQIFREKVVWQRCNANPQIHREVEVWNWQTGQLLWRRTFCPQVSYVFLDDNHLIITAVRQEEVMVYTLNEHDIAPANLDAPPVLTLELPLGAFRCAVHHDDRSRIHRSSNTDGLPFTPDPMLAVTAIRFSIYAPELSMALLLVPGSTFYEQLRVTEEENSPSRKVFWHEWGPTGALMLNMTSPIVVGRISVNIYGSRVALVVCRTNRQWFGSKESLDVVLLDLNPREVHAVMNAVSSQDSTTSLRLMPSEEFQQLQFSKLRATVPYVSYMGPELRIPDKHSVTMISMDADGMMVLNEWEPPYQERVGFGYQAFTYMA